jgi:hypothetical protein
MPETTDARVDPQGDALAKVERRGSAADPAADAEPFAAALEEPRLPPFAGTAASSGNWPATAPSAADAEQVLASALVGMRPGGDAPLDAVLSATTELDRAAMLGDSGAADAAAVRAALVLRYRVAAALATVPAAGTPVDAEAAGALLAELEAALARVKAAAGAAPPARAGALDDLRRALARDAVGLSEAIRRAAPPDAGGPAAPARRTTGSRARAGAAPAGARAGRRGRAGAVALALAVLAALAFHAYAWWSQQGR